MPAPASLPCPRCGRPVGPQFSGSGLCPTCAAARLLDQTHRSGVSLPAFADDAPGPEHVGPYQIIETLGVGGMGTVYLAQHRELGRIVALKVIPLHGGGGRELRFQREAQTVASLRHPHIVTVHDAGHDPRHFYFAMDYHEGGDLAGRLRRAPLAPREAAALLEKIARAVAYSHAQGVLHRDLKPSNILLEGDEPRVADFGLATPLETGGDLTQHTSVLGTPHYLAPEALLKGSAAQSPASDVYSLGVILYELLCARLPFTASTPVELQQLIATTEPLSPRLLAPKVPHDLETICLKSLATEPARRYATAAEFAEDLRRFLAGETILARPAAPAERLGRWARRRPSLAALWVLLAVIAAGSTAAAWRIDRERRAAESEAAKSRALAAFLQSDLLAQASPHHQPDRDLKVRTLLDRAAARIAGRFADDPLTEASVRATLATTYFALGENGAAEIQLRRVVAIRRGRLGAEHRDTLNSTQELAASLNRQGKNAEAAPLGRDTVATLTRLFGPEDFTTIHATNTLVDIEVSLGRFAEAEALARRAYESARTRHGPDHPETLTTVNNYASTLWAQNKFTAAEPLYLASVEAHTRILGAEHPETLAVKNNLATLYGGQGRYADAERINREVLTLRRRVLGPDHPETLRSLSNLAFAINNVGRPAEALTLYEELGASRRRVLGRDHPDTFNAEISYANSLNAVRRSAEGLPLLADINARILPALGVDNSITLFAKRSYANALIAAARPIEAIPLAQQILEIATRLFGAQDNRTLTSAETLANAHHLAGHYPEASALLRTTLEIRARTQPTNWRTALVRGLLGRSFFNEGKLAEAEPLLRASHETLQPATSGLPAGQRATLAEFARLLAKIATAAGRTADATAWTAKAAPPVAPPPQP